MIIVLCWVFVGYLLSIHDPFLLTILLSFLQRTSNFLDFQPGFLGRTEPPAPEASSDGDRRKLISIFFPRSQ